MEVSSYLVRMGSEVDTDDLVTSSSDGSRFCASLAHNCCAGVLFPSGAGIHNVAVNFVRNTDSCPRAFVRRGGLDCRTVGLYSAKFCCCQAKATLSSCDRCPARNGNAYRHKRLHGVVIRFHLGPFLGSAQIFFSCDRG